LKFASFVFIAQIEKLLITYYPLSKWDLKALARLDEASIVNTHQTALQLVLIK
jgi:hypothetical protein